MLTLARAGLGWTAYLDPVIGFRARKIEQKTGGGHITEEKRLSDYRIVNGIPFPFAVEIRKYNAASEVVFHEQVNVLSCEVNAQDKPDLALNIPAGAKLADLLHNNGRLIKLDAPATLSVEQLEGFARSIEIERIRKKLRERNGGGDSPNGAPPGQPASAPTSSSSE